uniref:BEN domain-containing protein n=1 Tax=Amblyomma maculatum TaxID=34609 RepID=G3MSS7_AMBMU
MDVEEGEPNRSDTTSQRVRNSMGVEEVEHNRSDATSQRVVRNSTSMNVEEDQHNKDSPGPSKTADGCLDAGKEVSKTQTDLFGVVDGQVLIGPQLWIPAGKWAYITHLSSDAKCVQEVARHLWTLDQAAERSLTGQKCRSFQTLGPKRAATPEKVEAVENCLEKFVDLHSAPGAPKVHRVTAVRQHLRRFFAETARTRERARHSAARRLSVRADVQYT